MERELISTIVKNDLFEGKKFYVRKKEGNEYVGVKVKDVLIHFFDFATSREEEEAIRISLVFADGNELNVSKKFNGEGAFLDKLRGFGYECNSKSFLYVKEGGEFVHSDALKYNCEWHFPLVAVNKTALKGAKPAYWYKWENHKVTPCKSDAFYNAVSGKLSCVAKYEKVGEGWYASYEECERDNRVVVVDFPDDEEDNAKSELLDEIRATEKQISELGDKLKRLRETL